MDRIKTLQSELNKKNIQAILITSKPNLRYFAGFEGSKGYLLVTQKKVLFLTDFRYMETAKKCLPKNVSVFDIGKKLENWKRLINRYKIRILGIEDNDMAILQYKSLRKASKKVKFKKTYPLLQEIREKKQEAEIRDIIKSQRINEKILFRVIKKIVRVGVKEREIAWEIEKLAHNLGTEGVAFSPIVAFSKNSSMPHAKPSNKRLRKGDMILIDMGVVYKGYHSDMTRTFFTVQPTEKQRKVYETVLKAQEKAIKVLHSGITGRKADKTARNVIEKAGYGENFGHASGHGVGIEIHELPNLSESYTKKFKENSVVTVEPGIYLEGKFGVRIEDMVIVTKKGPKIITKFKKDIKDAVLEI